VNALAGSSSEECDASFFWLDVTKNFDRRVVNISGR
jgi:hypothetical protein